MTIAIVRSAVVMQFSPLPEPTWTFFWSAMENTIGELYCSTPIKRGIRD